MSVQTPHRLRLTILLLQENRIFADVLARRLGEESEVERVEVVSAISDATAWLAERRADLLVVNHHHQGDDRAVALMSALSQLDHRPAVLVLSSRSDHRDVVAALESGVRGWTTTDYPFAAIWDAVREVASGHMVLSPTVVEPIVDHLLEVVRAAKPQEQRDFVSELSRREYEVLRCLVAGMTKKEIAHRLFLSVNTVRTHVQHLLKAADEHTTLALVAAARDLNVTGIDDSR